MLCLFWGRVRFNVSCVRCGNVMLVFVEELGGEEGDAVSGFVGFVYVSPRPSR